MLTYLRKPSMPFAQFLRAESKPSSPFSKTTGHIERAKSPKVSGPRSTRRTALVLVSHSKIACYVEHDAISGNVSTLIDYVV